MDAQLSDDGIDEALRVMYGHVPEWATFPLKDPSVIQLQASDTGGTWLVRPGRLSGTDPEDSSSLDEACLEGPSCPRPLSLPDRACAPRERLSRGAALRDPIPSMRVRPT